MSLGKHFYFLFVFLFLFNISFVIAENSCDYKGYCTIHWNSPQTNGVTLNWVLDSPLYGSGVKFNDLNSGEVSNILKKGDSFTFSDGLKIFLDDYSVPSGTSYDFSTVKFHTISNNCNINGNCVLHYVESINGFSLDYTNDELGVRLSYNGEETPFLLVGDIYRFNNIGLSVILEGYSFPNDQTQASVNFRIVDDNFILQDPNFCNSDSECNGSCLEHKCVSKSFFQKIWDWFKGIFS